MQLDKSTLREERTKEYKTWKRGIVNKGNIFVGEDISDFYTWIAYAITLVY